MSKFAKMNMKSITLPLRIAQLVFALVVLGLSGYVANWYNVDTLTSSPSQVNWLIAVPIFSVLSVVYLEVAPRFAPRMSHPWVAMGIECGNALFYFAGFIALAVFLNTLLFCRGTVCGAARADVFFSAMQFALWTLTTFLLAKDVFKGGMRKPALAQGPYPKEMKENSAA